MSENVLWMRAALDEAKAAGDAGDVPVGCVIVSDGNIVARGRNRRETDGDPTAHAEIVALREAARQLGHWRVEATLVVTQEPCPMCAGAIVWSRIPHVVYGASDPKAGAAGSVMNVLAEPAFNHRPELTSGVLAEECGELLKRFFAARRQS